MAKIIVDTGSTNVKYAFPSDFTIAIGSQMTTVVGDTGIPILVVTDMNNTNAMAVTATLPNGETTDTFIGDKYLFANGIFSNNPDYVPPPEPEQQPE